MTYIDKYISPIEFAATYPEADNNPDYLINISNTIFQAKEINEVVSGEWTSTSILESYEYQRIIQQRAIPIIKFSNKEDRDLIALMYL